MCNSIPKLGITHVSWPGLAKTSELWYAGNFKTPRDRLIKGLYSYYSFTLSKIPC